MELQDNRKWIVFMFLMLAVSVGYLSAQAPPPPSVPIDSGITVLIAAAVGYAASRKKKNL